MILFVEREVIMGRIKDLLYTGVPGMGYTDDLLREMLESYKNNCKNLIKE